MPLTSHPNAEISWAHVSTMELVAASGERLDSLDGTLGQVTNRREGVQGFLVGEDAVLLLHGGAD